MSAQQRTDFSATEAEVALARRFIGQRCVLGPTLVMPLRVLWREFSGWSPNATAHGLRVALELAPWARVEERRGRGRLKTVVLGVGVHTAARQTPDRK